MEKITLLKYLQKSKGLTRREFEEMIKNKSIKLNGETVESFDVEVGKGDNYSIEIPKQGIFEETVKRTSFHKPAIILFNKPKGYVVSKEDKHNKTIYDLLPESWRKDFYYIGRLDKDSHGLLLLTNEPHLVDYYENPKNRNFKIYEVLIDKPFKTHHIRKARKGFDVDENGVIPGARKDTITEGRVDNLNFYDVHYQYWKGKYKLRIVLKEGKKRHIRRMLKGLGYEVLDLMRIKFGIYEIGAIKTGKYMVGKMETFRKKRTKAEREARRTYN